jgi:hypothetical protein
LAGSMSNAEPASAASMLRIIMIVLVVAAVVTGGILMFSGKGQIGAVLFFLGCIGAGFLLPPSGHDSTGGASDC